LYGRFDGAQSFGEGCSTVDNRTVPL